ncbi:MAG: M48 family metalloprotease [Proteobacteria bacterium]|nr:M48 family metalloprotease [Pseudomonadota bacterium]
MIVRTALAPLDHGERRRHKLRNAVQSLLLMGGMVGLLALCTAAVTGGDGVFWVALGVALALYLSPRVSPRLVLAMYGAVPLRPYQLPAVFEVLGELAVRAGLPRVPGLHYVPSAMVNAFAVGRQNDAAIAITDGMLRALDLRELAGVLAHELSHVRNNDLWIMSMADTVSRLTRLMSQVGVALLFVSLPLWLAEYGGVPWLLILLLVVAPTVGSLLQLALARAREFDADLDAAGLTGDPAGLASALEKIERVQGGLWGRIFFPDRRTPEPSLLRTHPSTEERIRRLLALYAPEGGRAFRVPTVILVPEDWPPIVGRPRRRRLTGLWY